MLPVRGILHPTDFSDLSNNAFRLACGLAEDYHAPLHILHVATAFERVVKIVRRTVTAESSGGWGKSNQPQSADWTVIQPLPMSRYFGAQFSTARIEQSCLM